MYLYGASGHAKVIIDILESSGISVSGLFDDDPTIKELCGRPVLGKFAGQALDAPLILSIGDNAIRAKFSKSLQLDFGTAIHPSAIISPSATIAMGTVVMQGVIVQAEAKVGKQVILNTNASIDHECVVGDFAHISPSSVLSGRVKIGEGAFIGSGAVLIPGIKVGKWCTIGAGAVVIKDIPPYCTAVGNPARIIQKT